MKKMDQGFMIKLRNEPSIIRIERPTRPDKARMLGYKAKTGYVIVRVKIGKGGRKKRAVHMGRKPSKSGMLRFTSHESLQLISEKRANRKYPNLEVVNSYYLTEDGTQKWYEIILTKMPVRGRVYRGLTSQGRRAKGTLHKGKKSA